MRSTRRVVLVLAFIPALAGAQADGPVTRAYRARADRIVAAALLDSAAAWNRVARFTDYSGGRLSGSASLERSLDWLIAEMRKDGLENVRSEPVMVPHWERGSESANLIEPRAAPLPMLGLGGSVGTPEGGITAEVLVVSGFEELTARAAEARGKIVLFDVPFTTYTATVPYRVYGAIAAAKVRAVASLVRSVTPFSMSTPHTGSMNYDSAVVAWEAVRLLKRLGLRPRRTIRVVAWVNEENGFRGGAAYRDAHRSEADDHVLAIESDGGVFAPLGFGFTGSDSARKIIRQVSALLSRIDADGLGDVGGGADIGPIMQLGVPGMALIGEGLRSFWFHHTGADTVDKLDPVEMQKCVAAMAVMAFVIADLPERLPRSSR